MLILFLQGMYFDAAVVFIKTFLLLFILALAILWLILFVNQIQREMNQKNIYLCGIQTQNHNQNL